MKTTAVILLALLAVGCASGPHSVAWSGSWLSRVMGGDIPRTPDEAQAALDEITLQVQQMETVPRAACLVACARPDGCPPACIEAEQLRLRLLALRVTFQASVDQWRAAGGSASEAASAAFVELLRARRPELAALVDLLRVWRGETVPDGGSIIP